MWRRLDSRAGLESMYLRKNQGAMINIELMSQLNKRQLSNGWSAPYAFKIDCRLAGAWWQPSTCRGGRSDFGSFGSGEFDVVVSIF